METGSIIFLALIALSGLYLIKIYNNLIQIKHNVSKAWSNIDVLLKQRHDEIPKLVEICKHYMKFEKETLEKVMQARNQVSTARKTAKLQELGKAEETLRMRLGNLFAVAEAYPDLIANENFLHLRKRISATETAISDRRVFYNESVNINNTHIEQFPDIFIARLLNFKYANLLEFRVDQFKDVNINQLFAE